MTGPPEGFTAGLTRGARLATVSIVALSWFWFWPLGGNPAHAGSPAKLEVEKVKVGLSDGSGGGPGISALVELNKAEGDGIPFPLHTLDLVGDLGSLDLTGVPTCKPSLRSPSSSGCEKMPEIGAGHARAYEVTLAPGDTGLRLDGTIKIYSGGQRGGVSRLWAWASFPDGGQNEAGRAFVVPMTLTRKGSGRSELRARFPRVNGVQFSFLQLLLSLRRSVRFGGRSVPLTKVGCPVGAGAAVTADATFYGFGSVPFDAMAVPTCQS